MTRMNIKLTIESNWTDYCLYHPFVGLEIEGHDISYHLEISRFGIYWKRKLYGWNYVCVEPVPLDFITWLCILGCGAVFSFDTLYFPTDEQAEFFQFLIGERKRNGK